jgi:predicted PurR-regulated permease PerM
MAQSGSSGSGSKIGLLPTVCLVIAIIYLAQNVLIPLAVAVLLAFLLTPAVNWLQRRRLGRVLPIIIVVVASLAVVAAITWVVEQQFVQVAEQLPKYRDNIQHKLSRFRNSTTGGIDKAAAGVESTLKSIATTNPATGAAVNSPSTPRGEAPTTPISLPNPNPAPENSDPWNWPKLILQYSGQVLSPLATIGLILVFMIFLLADRRNGRIDAMCAIGY